MIVSTDVDNGWTISKKSQPFPTHPLPPGTDWLINKNPGVINDTWTSKVVIANYTQDQIIPIGNVGNNAKPIWIAKDLCNNVDFAHLPSTYNFRKTFYLSDCANIEKAILQFTTDNISRVYINGKQIQRNGGWLDYPGSSVLCKTKCGFPFGELADNPPAKSFNSQGINVVEIADVKEYLEAGVNVLAIENLNAGGCETNFAWICFNLEISYTGSNLLPHIDTVNNLTCDKEGGFIVGNSGGVEPVMYKIDNLVSQNSSHFENIDVGSHQVTVTDAVGCEFQLPVTIEDWRVYPQLAINAWDLFTDCTDTTAFISFEPGSDGFDLQFSFDNGVFEEGPVFNSLKAGDHTVTALNEFGCKSEPITFNVTYEDGYIYRNESIRICNGESADIFGKTYTTSAIVRDTISSLIRCDTIYAIDLEIGGLQESMLIFKKCAHESILIGAHEYRDFGNYSQLLKDNYGCDSTLHIRIDAEDERKCAEGDCDFFIPNAFSPNQDGINDQWVVKADYIEMSQLNIFNRWGGQVFTSTGREALWDGTSKGKPAESGNYVYLLKGKCANGFEFIRSGSVTLVR